MSLRVSPFRHHLLRWAICVPLLAMFACDDPQRPDSLVGLWRGSNAVFTQFQLNLQSQTENQVWGSALFVFAQTAATAADTDFVAAIARDSLHFSQPVPAFTGYTTVEFRGRQDGARIGGIANGVAIVLDRQ